MYEFGLRLPTDYQRASEYYRSSCASEFAQGCTNLGWMYAVGRGVQQDGRTAMILFTRAFDGYRMACQRGEIEGCLLAVSHLQQGLVESADEREELALLQRACELGHEPSCSRAR
jgi:TPR repeat protein